MTVKMDVSILARAVAGTPPQHRMAPLMTYVTWCIQQGYGVAQGRDILHDAGVQLGKQEMLNVWVSVGVACKDVRAQLGIK